MIPAARGSGSYGKWLGCAAILVIPPQLVNLCLLCSCTATRLQHLIEPQIARAFAPSDLISERRPEPGRAIRPACQSTLPSDTGAFARDFLVIEQKVCKR